MPNELNVEVGAHITEFISATAPIVFRAKDSPLITLRSNQKTELTMISFSKLSQLQSLKLFFLVSSEDKAENHSIMKPKPTILSNFERISVIR